VSLFEGPGVQESSHKHTPLWHESIEGSGTEETYHIVQLDVPI
jgi:hypothetical protein